MSRVRGLELLFNLEKKNFKSKEDCIVAVFHCLLINEGFQCVGIGDEWPHINSASTELLPQDWNSNQDVYSLRYITKNLASRILVKIVKSGHMLLVNAVLNEDSVASVHVPTATYVLDDYSEYASAYKDLDALIELFRREITEKIKPEAKTPSSSKGKRIIGTPPRSPELPQRPEPELRRESGLRFPFPPRIGGADLDPFGGSGGGMLMDPSSFGIPARPTLPQFGIGGPGGLPRGAVPPGARFDPIRPPIHPNRPKPDPDHFRPPDNDDYYM